VCFFYRCPKHRSHHDIFRLICRVRYRDKRRSVDVTFGILIFSTFSLPGIPNKGALFQKLKLFSSSGEIRRCTYTVGSSHSLDRARTLEVSQCGVFLPPHNSSSRKLVRTEQNCMRLWKRRRRRKVNFTLEHNMKIHRGSRGIVLLLL
jgi:hypothetical protein